MHTEPVVPPAVSGFQPLGLTAPVLGALRRLNFEVPTPIQEKAIPIALKGTDVIGIAQTGTGKTLAFALPLIERLLKGPGTALVLVPTRELALQVEESVRKVARQLNPALRVTCLIGGAPIYRQVTELKANPRVIIATPGRLQDHLNQGTAKLNEVAVLVLDEADRMLDMGFAPQIKRILSVVPADRQTLLFSATLAPEIAKLAAEYLHNPERVEVSIAGSSNRQITQELCYVSHGSKPELLEQFLQSEPGTILVFSRTKHGASKLSRKLELMGHKSAEIHSNRSLGQRRQALDGFKSGRYRILVATDVAARGIDVPDIALVINYDLPDAAEDYVHRVGRTGRAGKTGHAVSFATPDQRMDVRKIERLISQQLTISTHSPEQAGSDYGHQPSSGGNGRTFTPRSQQRPSQSSGSSSSHSGVSAPRGFLPTSGGRKRSSFRGGRPQR